MLDIKVNEVRDTMKTFFFFFKKKCLYNIPNDNNIIECNRA
jgi:hypothetical protein